MINLQQRLFCFRLLFFFSLRASHHFIFFHEQKTGRRLENWCTCTTTKNANHYTLTNTYTLRACVWVWVCVLSPFALACRIVSHTISWKCTRCARLLLDYNNKNKWHRNKIASRVILCSWEHTFGRRHNKNNIWTVNNCHLTSWPFQGKTFFFLQQNEKTYMFLFRLMMKDGFGSQKDTVFSALFYRKLNMP